MAKRKKLDIVFTSTGRILIKVAYFDEKIGIFDNKGINYPVGFDKDGGIYSSFGISQSGLAIFEDESETPFFFDQNYTSFVNKLLDLDEPNEDFEELVENFDEEIEEDSLEIEEDENAIFIEYHKAMYTLMWAFATVPGKTDHERKLILNTYQNFIKKPETKSRFVKSIYKAYSDDWDSEFFNEFTEELNRHSHEFLRENFHKIVRNYTWESRKLMKQKHPKYVDEFRDSLIKLAERLMECSIRKNFFGKEKYNEIDEYRFEQIKPLL